MTLDIPSEVCLGVAVDHRIRRLFKPVSNKQGEHSKHVSFIEERGRSLGRSPEEIRVTAQIAGPAVKGGIVVALQQPRDNHPFEKGLNAVINDCETLYALDEIFTVVSCGTLDIRADISIVDLLPYVSEDAKEIDDTKLKESFRASKQIICEKEPDILLCAGRIWLPKMDKHDDRKEGAWRFESIGLGKKFGINPKLLVEVKVRYGERGFIAISRVNGFHPSHAMNRNPHISILRQLQILIGAETCGKLRDDWKNEEWMDKLRHRCQNTSRPLSEVSPSKSPSPQSPGQSSTRSNSTKYLPDYQELYAEALSDLEDCVNTLTSDPEMAKKSHGALYDTLLSSGLSEFCNNTALILQKMSFLQRKRWPDSVAWKNDAALKEAATRTLQFVENLQKATKQGNNSQPAKTIWQAASSIHEQVMVGSGKRPKHELDLSGTGNAFLKLATDIEAQLSDLLLKKEKMIDISGQEKVLSSMMSRVNLAP